MRKSNPIVATSIVLLAIVMLFGVAFAPSNNNSSVGASWAEHFENAAEMEEAADIVISGKLQNSETELRGNLIFTMNTIEVLSVHKGTNVNPGETIKLLQTGGTFKGKTTQPFTEIPLLTEDVEYLLFLEDSPADGHYEQYYLIMGGYQGVASKSANGTYQALSTANSTFIERASADIASMMAEEEVSQ